MVKPMDQFGGWLSFFQLTCWFNVIILPIVGIVILFALLAPENRNEFWILVISLFDLTIAFYLFLKMVKMIKIKEKETPNRIVKIMNMIILMTLFFALIELCYYYFTVGIDGLSNFKDTAKSTLQMFTWYGIWTAYLNRSKRVLIYYGTNAGKHN